jgi:hypothetical protein
MKRRCVLALVLFTVALLTACGGSSPSSSSSRSTPLFTSTPVTQASQGVAYSYQLAAIDPAGGSVTFALSTMPSGATLGGNTVNWTPTAAESRVSNNFVATATTSSMDGDARGNYHCELGYNLLVAEWPSAGIGTGCASIGD